MDLKTLDRVGDFLKNASPEQLQEIAEGMTENAPNLFNGLGLLGEVSLSERAAKYIQIQLNMIAEAELRIPLNSRYYQAKGFIDGIWFAKLIDDDTREHYNKLADDALDKRERELFPNEYPTSTIKHITLPADKNREK